MSQARESRASETERPEAAELLSFPLLCRAFNVAHYPLPDGAGVRQLLKEKTMLFYACYVERVHFGAHCQDQEIVRHVCNALADFPLESGPLR